VSNCTTFSRTRAGGSALAHSVAYPATKPSSRNTFSKVDCTSLIYTSAASLAVTSAPILRVLLRGSPCPQGSYGVDGGTSQQPSPSTAPGVGRTTLGFSSAGNLSTTKIANAMENMNTSPRTARDCLSSHRSNGRFLTSSPSVKSHLDAKAHLDARGATVRR